MKIAWVGIVGEGIDWLPMDVGLAVSEGVDEDYKMLGYTGVTVSHPSFDLYKDKYPKLAQTNDLIPTSKIETADIEMAKFLDKYLEADEPVTLVHRNPWHILTEFLPVLCSYPEVVIQMNDIDPLMAFLGIPLEYKYDPSALPERAVEHALYYHAENQLYRNNIMAWGNEELQAWVDELSADREAQE